jgi:hypothetical protein
MENSIIRNLIIANSIIGNDDFAGSQALVTFQRSGSFVTNVDTFNINQPLDYGAFVAETGSWSSAQATGVVNYQTIFALDPMFADAVNGDFTLDVNSPIRTLGHDGKALGDRRWSGELVTGIIELNNYTPDDYSLSQNYPNPFNPSTTIEFSVQAPGRYTLTVFNILGQEVANLVDQELSSGVFRINFDASNLSSGIYLYRLSGNKVNITKKMMLIK